jgi:hypothetical protein
MRNIWFYRDYQEFTGGHLKHSHYFGNACLHPQLNPHIYFAANALSKETSAQRKQLWGDSNIDLQWVPQERDIIFLAGMDWQFALSQGRLSLSMPRLNLIQGVRHADPNQSLYKYLSQPAIRLCVSEPVAEAIKSTGRVNGPVFVIPNGVDIKPGLLIDVSRKGLNQVKIIGYKNSDFATAIGKKLSEKAIDTEIILQAEAREKFIEKLDPDTLVVCCPLREEGFYLPALEAMAKGCLVVVPDCVGNRAYAHDRVNCLRPDYDLESVFSAIQYALSLSHLEQTEIRRAALRTAAEHTLEKERTAFHEIIDNIDQLWQEISS